MQGRTRAWVIGLATVGLIAAASSTYMHFQLANDPFYTSFCDVNASVSCTQLYQGPYGSVGGIPVALGGVFWFGVVLAYGYEKSRSLIPCIFAHFVNNFLFFSAFWLLYR